MSISDGRLGRASSCSEPCPTAEYKLKRLSVREDVMNRDRMRRAGRALFAASILGVAPPALGAALDQEQASAAAAGLSPQDRCAIAKLEAASREAACLTDAQIEGIRQGLTDQQVNRRKAACRQREHASFENAEDRPGKCKTLNDDAVVDYALKLATDVPRACGEDGPPCNARNPETLSTMTLRNGTEEEIFSAQVSYLYIPFLCTKHFDRINPSRINPGQIGSANAGSCLIMDIGVFKVYREEFQIRCEHYSAFPTGTAYR